MLSRASVRPKSPESALDEYVFHDERHFVSWQQLGKSDIGTVTNLHERNYQIERIKEGYFSYDIEKTRFSIAGAAARGGEGWSESRPLRHFS
jgi:hypothetical protein